jgi:hypothetical protein
VLAYASTAERGRVTTCLVYPCRQKTWESLEDRGRVAHRAEIGAGERQVELVLAAAPIGGGEGEVVERLGRVLR